MTEKTVR